MRTGLRVIIAVFVVAVIGALAYFFATPPAPASAPSSRSTSQSDIEAASSTVAHFGAVLKQVSLLAPNASSTIAKVYAPYVAPELLLQWETDPSSAPGRQVSSPWPDHIDITSAEQYRGAVYVRGNIVLMTSNEIEHGGNAGLVPFFATVGRDHNGSWYITSFIE